MRLFEGTPFDRPLRCEVCEELEENCTCPPPELKQTAPETQHLKITEEKRKQGKTVTVIRGFADDQDFPSLLSDLKSRCGAGGTIQANDLEIQGKHTERLQILLRQLGYNIK